MRELEQDDRSRLTIRFTLEPQADLEQLRERAHDVLDSMLLGAAEELGYTPGSDAHLAGTCWPLCERCEPRVLEALEMARRASGEIS